MSVIAVTGSTGVVGGAVARGLAAAGQPIRLVVRDAARAPQLPGAEIATATYGDAAMQAALVGVQTLFLVSASEDANRVALHTATVDAAVAAGVERIVYLSFYGAAPDSTFTFGRDHWHTEAGDPRQRDQIHFPSRQPLPRRARELLDKSRWCARRTGWGWPSRRRRA